LQSEKSVEKKLSIIYVENLKIGRGF
jgi:hypothetical protein